VPKFGVWDEQTAESAAQGFTVQFENVKRHRDGARAAMPAVPRAPSPPEGDAARRAHHHQKTPFVSKVHTTVTADLHCCRVVHTYGVHRSVLHSFCCAQMFGCFLPADKDRERRCI
jgi:hypothetical protein